MIKKIMKIFIGGLIMTGMLLKAATSTKANDLNQSVRRETIETLTKMLSEKYLYPETAQKMTAKLSENLKTGKYDQIKDFGQFGVTLTADLFEIAKDKHLNITYSPASVEEIRKGNNFSESEKKDYALKQKTTQSKINFGFQKLEIMPGNIGYLKLSTFAKYEYASETAIGAMNFLSNSDVVIIDLRDNDGGFPDMIQFIASCFFDYDEVVNQIMFEGHETYSKRIFTYRILPNLPVKRMPKIPLYILVNAYSISSAEVFAYSLQQLGRAEIVGEQTIFGVNGSYQSTEVLNDYYTIFLPKMKLISPITKSNCEGVGVIPDIKTESKDALDATVKIIHEKQNANKPEETIDESDASLKPYIGIYEFDSNTTMTISGKGTQMLVQVTGRPAPFEIFLKEKDKFHLPGFGIEVDFISENDKVTSLNFTRNKKTSFAKKVK